MDTLETYRDFLKSKLDIMVLDLNKKDLSNLIEEREKQYKMEIEKIKQLKTEYTKLEKFTVNLLPYLQTENAKIEIKKKGEELIFLDKEVSPLLENEKKNTRRFLEKKVQSFFYTVLINKIYNKIDPHPDFKSVEIKANFDADSPRLDIFVVNSKNEEKLIPNLYFSTAQINVLSLSIFLASALNSKEYDCIFIDDPIQSMDSINVLSTIDLIRSLIVNENKQIILSTHDENFHNLLKKKMPKRKFKSKFIELETFGKVKPEEEIIAE
jgi:DNA repair protein SbcC/Rad50